MSNLMQTCAQGALATTSFIQNRLTVEFLRTNKFLAGVQILSTDQCTVYGAPMANGVTWSRQQGGICGKVNDSINTYKGRICTLENLVVSKSLCKEQVMCSSFSVADFARLMRDEIWLGFINELETMYIEAMFSDTITSEKTCNKGIVPVKATDDNITGTTIAKVAKADITADTVYQWLASIVSKFRAAKIGATGITLFVPYEMELLISGAMANKQCCQWYSDIMFDNNSSGYTIAGMPITIISLQKDLFPKGATGYTRIIAVANNRIVLAYNNFKIYGNFDSFAPQYLDPQAVQLFMRSLPPTSMIDFDVSKGDSDDIGVVMRMKALAHVQFYRMHQKSILLIDAKDDIFA